MFPVSREIVVRLAAGEDTIITMIRIINIIISSHWSAVVITSQDADTRDRDHRGNIGHISQGPSFSKLPTINYNNIRLGVTSGD